MGDAESNWLPAPDGPAIIALRMYLPKPAILDGTWTPPAVKLAQQPNMFG